MTEHFWFVDDEHRVRWAVRVGRAPDGSTRILFTSRDGQIGTRFLLDKEERQLTRAESLELLARAKGEAVSGFSLLEAAGF